MFELNGLSCMVSMRVDMKKGDVALSIALVALESIEARRVSRLVEVWFTVLFLCHSSGAAEHMSDKVFIRVCIRDPQRRQHSAIFTSEDVKPRNSFSLRSGQIMSLPLVSK